MKKADIDIMLEKILIYVLLIALIVIIFYIAIKGVLTYVK